MSLNVVDISTTQISLEWIFGFNGNAEITQVTVSYVTVDNFIALASDTVILQPPVTTTTISGLEPNTQYNFTVIATNAVGSSQPATVQEWTEPLSE